MSTLQQLGEFHLHRWLQQNIPSANMNLLGIGDDSALLDMPPNHNILISTDRVPLDLSGRYAGKYSVIQNFSDIVCKGGKPIALVLAFLLRSDTEEFYFKEIIQSASENAALYGGYLVGGDTKQADVNIIVGTAIGIIEKGIVISRSGARPGDLVAVSLKHGWKVGWRWSKHLADYYDLNLPIDMVRKLITRYDERLAIPFQETRAAIMTGWVTSCMDITDGLSESLNIISVKSNVGFLIDEDKLIKTVDNDLQVVTDKLGIPLIKLGWSPGYDWENLFTVKEDKFAEVQSQVRLTGGDLVAIGKVIDSPTAEIIVNRIDGKRVTLNPFDGTQVFKYSRSDLPKLWLDHIYY